MAPRKEKKPNKFLTVIRWFCSNVVKLNPVFLLGHFFCNTVRT